MLLFASWAIAQLFSYLHFEIRSSVDTARYLKIAQSLYQGGHLSQDADGWYVSYGATIAFFQTIGLAIEWVVVLNLTASLLAMVSIYQLTFRFFGDWRRSFVACMLYILFLKISQWNFILYTDGLFTSCCIITINCYLWSSSKKSLLSVSVCCLMLLYTVFLRPVGLVFLASFLMAIALSDWRKLQWPYLAFLVLMILWGANWVLLDYHDSFVEAYRTAEIIYPDLTLGIGVPAQLILPDEDYFPLLRIFLFIAYNPVFFSKLFFTKAFLFLTGVRPYFSQAHNGSLLVFLLPCYLFAIVGWRSIPKVFRLFTLLFVGSQIVMVGLTTVNWDGRFLLPMLPFVFVLSANGLMTNKAFRRLSD